MSIDLIHKAIKETKEKLAGTKIDASDMKSKARIFKAAIKDFALKANIQLDNKES